MEFHLLTHIGIKKKYIDSILELNSSAKVYKWQHLASTFPENKKTQFMEGSFKWFSDSTTIRALHIPKFHYSNQLQNDVIRNSLNSLLGIQKTLRPSGRIYKS